ncbi:MAG TPA: hypothetical protein VNL36_05030 [Bacteroidota bacterium]|nr:hypothetical protein [Bacteroidota bacterium]
MKVIRPEDTLHTMLVRELRSALTNVHSSNFASSLDEGDTYICSTCDLAIKICAGNPNAICILKVRQNTELDLLLHEYASLLSGSHRHCVECGKTLSTRQLKKNPLLELCSTCRPRTRKMRRADR